MKKLTAALCSAAAIVAVSSTALATPPAGASGGSRPATPLAQAQKIALSQAKTGTLGPMSLSVRPTPDQQRGPGKFVNTALLGRNVRPGLGTKWKWTGASALGRTEQDIDHGHVASNTVQHTAGPWQHVTETRHEQYAVDKGDMQRESTQKSTRLGFLFQRNSDKSTETIVAPDKTKTTTEIDLQQRGMKTTATVRVKVQRPGEAPQTATATATGKWGREAKLK